MYMYLDHHFSIYVTKAEVVKIKYNRKTCKLFHSMTQNDLCGTGNNRVDNNVV